MAQQFAVGDRVIVIDARETEVPHGTLYLMNTQDSAPS
jgi:hypothetical protein